MASNGIKQNPRNKVGRNSGAGPDGVTRVAPSSREAERGLTAFSIDETPGWIGPLAMGLGVVALVGVGLAAYATQKVRQQRSLRYRLENLVGWR